MGARRCQSQQEFRYGAENGRCGPDHTRENKHDGEKIDGLWKHLWPC